MQLLFDLQHQWRPPLQHKSYSETLTWVAIKVLKMWSGPLIPSDIYSEGPQVSHQRWHQWRQLFQSRLVLAVRDVTNGTLNQYSRIYFLDQSKWLDSLHKRKKKYGHRWSFSCVSHWCFTVVCCCAGDAPRRWPFYRFRQRTNHPAAGLDSTHGGAGYTRLACKASVWTCCSINIYLIFT